MGSDWSVGVWETPTRSPQVLMPPCNEDVIIWQKQGTLVTILSEKVSSQEAHGPPGTRV